MYNTQTKAVICLRLIPDSECVVRVYVSNESNGLFELKRTMTWTAVKGEEDQLWSIEIDSNNVMYGWIVRKSDLVNRVEILDKEYT